MLCKTAYSPKQEIIEQLSYQAACSVCQFINNAGFKAYITGGALRDFLLEIKIPTDYDIATNASPEDIYNIFGKISFVGKSFAVCRVKHNNIYCEVATFRKEGLYSDKRHPDSVAMGTHKEDSERRDFTCNALYFDPITGLIYDFHEGIIDIQNKILRTVGNENIRFAEDILRIIRLFRFAVNLNFVIDNKTLLAAKKNARHLISLSSERLIMEIEKIDEGKFTKFVNLLHTEINFFYKRFILKTETINYQNIYIDNNIHKERPYFALCACYLLNIVNTININNIFILFNKAWKTNKKDLTLVEFVYKYVKFVNNNEMTNFVLFKFLNDLRYEKISCIYLWLQIIYLIDKENIIVQKLLNSFANEFNLTLYEYITNIKSNIKKRHKKKYISSNNVIDFVTENNLAQKYISILYISINFFYILTYANISQIEIDLNILYRDYIENNKM